MAGVVDTPRAGLQSEAEVLDWAQRVLGPLERLEETTTLASPHSVVRLVTRSGDEVVAKWFFDTTCFFHTLDALTDHTPALGGSAPKLIDHNQGLKAIVMTSVPGAPVVGDQALDPTLHYQAGVLLRQFHESAPRTQSSELAKQWATSLSALVDHSEELLGSALVQEARTLAMELLDLGPITLSPVHGSFLPEHWLFDADRGLHLIGYSRSEYDPWVVDTVALDRHYWCYSPELRGAFFAGYDREPDASDGLIMRVRELLDVLGEHEAIGRQRVSKAEATRQRRDLDAAFGGTLF